MLYKVLIMDMSFKRRQVKAGIRFYSGGVCQGEWWEMSDLIPFRFESKEIRVTDQNGDPWFVANDIADRLRIGNIRQALTRLDDDEKGVILNDTPGGKQEISIISESGLYRLIGSSRKKNLPEVKRFQDWLYKELLPSIRKTGKYDVSQSLTTTSSSYALLKVQQALAEAQSVMAGEIEQLKADVAEIKDRRPPEGKSRVEDWLRRHSKPFLPRSVMKQLRAECRHIEAAEMFRPEGFDFAMPFWSNYTIAKAYGEVTRQLSFMEEHRVRYG